MHVFATPKTNKCMFLQDGFRVKASFPGFLFWSPLVSHFFPDDAPCRFWGRQGGRAHSPKALTWQGKGRRFPATGEWEEGGLKKAGAG
jgi:hypothetical protein